MKPEVEGYGNKCLILDYIIFVESFPVIPESIMQTMIHYSIQLLSPKGKIIFIHNLLQKQEQMKQLPAMIKPYIKYALF
jgi:hypothetical protein